MVSLKQKFKFAITKSSIYANNQNDNFTFDINNIRSVNVNFSIIPMHNFFSSNSHDVFDQLVFESVYFIVGLFKNTSNEQRLVNILVYSNEDVEDVERNIYGINTEYDIDIFNFDTPTSYVVKLGFYVGNDDFQDNREAAIFYMNRLVENQLFESVIPFENQGGWIHE